MDMNNVYWQLFVTACWDLVIFANLFGFFFFKREIPKAIRYLKANPDLWIPEWYSNLHYRIQRMKKHSA